MIEMTVDNSSILSAPPLPVVACDNYVTLSRHGKHVGRVKASFDLSECPQDLHDFIAKYMRAHGNFNTNIEFGGV